MVAQEEPRYMSVEEWRVLLESSDIKYEYRNGWVVAMAGGSANHSTIAINAIEDLRRELGDSGCRVYNTDMAVRLSPNEYRFSDAVVTCSEHDRGEVKEIRAPRVAIEVLSDSTERDDRTDKLALYQACPSVQEYVLISTRYQAVEVYRRAPGDWTAHVYRPGETAELSSIGVRLVVSALYRLTDVPTPKVPSRQVDSREQAPS